MGDILVPYILPFLGFKDYSINGGGPPTAAKLPCNCVMGYQIFTKLLALDRLVHMAALTGRCRGGWGLASHKTYWKGSY